MKTLTQRAPEGTGSPPARRFPADWVPLRPSGTILRLTVLVPLLTLLALGFWSRMANLDQPPLWDDERGSVLGATGQTVILPYNAATVTLDQLFLPVTPDVPDLRTGFTPATIWAKNQLGNVIQATRQLDRGNGLLFNLLLHGWISLAGLDDAALKLLPVLLGTVTLATLFLGLRTVGVGLLGATLATMVAAQHPLLIWSSRELRPYALATLLAVLATMLLLRLIQECEDGQPAAGTAVLYVFAAVGALLTHYQTVYVFAGHGFWALLTVRDRRPWLILLVVAGTAGGAFALWLATAGADGLKVIGVHDQLWLQRAQSGQFSWLQTTTLDRIRGALLGNFVQYLMLQPIWFYQEKFARLLPGPDAAAAAALGWEVFGAALFVLAGASLWAARKWDDRRARLRLLMLILAAMGPLMAAMLALRSGHMLPFISRYMVFSAPFAAVFLGLCAADLVDRAAWNRLSLITVLPLQALLCVMCLTYWQAPDRFGLPPDPRGDLYLKAAAQIAAAARPGDLVVYAAPYDAVLLSLYLRDQPDLRSVVEDHGPPDRPAVLIRRGGAEIPVVEKLS
jgi:uncharacterized membrane protein